MNNEPPEMTSSMRLMRAVDIEPGTLVLFEGKWKKVHETLTVQWALRPINGKGLTSQSVEVKADDTFLVDTASLEDDVREPPT